MFKRQNTVYLYILIQLILYHTEKKKAIEKMIKYIEKGLPLYTTVL